MSASITQEKSNWLDRPLLAFARLDVEKTLYLIFIVLAIVTRFWMLGNRVMSHDESLHAYYSWNLYKGGGFSHTPLMHGPFKFLLNASIYSLFGADDFTARISAALFSVALVGLPYFLRRWLGRTGALVTSFMLLISPSIWYHGRYIRDEAFMLVWGTVIVWAMFAYLRDRQRKWLYLMATTLALAYTTMEAAFIFAIIFGTFILVAAFVELSKHKDFWGGILARSLIGLVGAALFTIVVVFIQARLMGALGLGPGDPMPFPPAPQPIQPGMPIEFSTQLQYTLQSLWAALRVLVFWLGPAILIGVAVYYWFRYILPARLRESRSFDLAALILTLSLFMLSAGALVVFNPVWKTLTGEEFFVSVKFFTDGNFPTNDIGPVMRLGALFWAFVAVSAAIGWWWNRRVWLITTAIFVGIGATLFTTVFTNGIGLGTGFVGSLGYWLEQQGVQRGSQPLYYYFVVTPIYEYLPMLISIIAIAAYFIRWIRNRRAGVKPTADWDQRLFVPFLIWWTLASWAAFSYAGEKMPWLMVYLALPMIMLSGRYLGEWFDSIDWRAVVRERQWLAGLLLAAAVVAGAWLLGNLQKAFSGLQQDAIAAFSAWLAALIVLGFAIWALRRMEPRPTWHVLLRMGALIVLGVLTVLTIRTGWTWNFINYDSALEFGVYAHGGPGVKVAMQQIDELAQRAGGAQALRIGFDSDASWPYYWYLRDYPNKFQYSNSPSRGDLDAPVIISSGNTWSIVDSVVNKTHTQWQGHRIWWPMEDYKVFAECPATEINPATGASVNVAAYDENGDGTIDAVEKANGQARCAAYTLRHLPEYAGTIVTWLLDPARRSALLDIFLNRDYTQYDQLRGEVHKPENWPLVDDFRLYVKRDLASQLWTEALGTTAAAQQPAVDPYAKGWRDIAAVQVFGSPGSGPGQFQSPQGISVGADGTIYVADSLNHRIQKFDQNGKFITSMGGPAASTDPGKFKEPWSASVAPDGSLYVADTWNHRIQHLKPDGTFISMWGTNADTGGQAVGSEGGFYGPRGITVDASGRVIVTDTGNKRVQIFKPDGSFISQFGGSGLQPGSLDEPVGVATDAQGNIVVADTWNGRVQVFDKNGQPTGTWDIGGWLDKDTVGKPYLAVDRAGRVYVADQVGRRILVFDQTGKYLGSFGQYGTDNRGFGLPSGIAVDKDGYVYVVDSMVGRVLKFPPFVPQ